MALFRKKSSETNIPELQEYYANQKRESTGLAWLLAVGSLLITAAVIIGLFVGGRWAYRKIAKKDKTTVATVQTTTQSTGSSSTTSTSTSTTPSTTPKSTPTPTPTPTPTTTPVAAPTTTTTSTTTTPAPGVSTTQSATTNTSAVAASTTIPNTGAGNTIGLFTVLTIGAYVAHRAFTLRKINR